MILTQDSSSGLKIGIVKLFILLAQHSFINGIFTNVDVRARPSSFVKYIGHLSYNDSNVVTGQHCRSTLAQHYVHRLKHNSVNVAC